VYRGAVQQIEAGVFDEEEDEKNREEVDTGLENRLRKAGRIVVAASPEETKAPVPQAEAGRVD